MWWFITGHDELLPDQEFEGHVLFNDSSDSNTDEGFCTVEYIQPHAEHAHQSLMVLNAHALQ